MTSGSVCLLLQLAGASLATSANAQPTASVVRADTGSRVEAAATTTRAAQAPFDASRFDSITAITLRGMFDDAAEMGLPTRPLVNRALEGAARRISSERILRVVREFAAALYEARQALGAGSTDDELDAGASALRAGLEARDLTAVRVVRKPGTAVTPLVVLTDLVKRGVPISQSRVAVVTLARTPHTDDALLGLQATVAKNAQRGPGMAVAALDRYVRSTVSGLSPSSTPGTAGKNAGRPPEP